MSIKKISNKDLLLFISQINILLKQNITIDKALLYLKNNSSKKNIFINKINKLVQDGYSLSYSFTKLSDYSKSFDSFFISIIELGEKSASLQKSFEILDKYLQSYNKIKTNLKNCCIYPVVVLTTIIIFIFFLLYYLIPSFEDFYHNLNTQLPYRTKLIINFKNYLSDFISKYFLIIMGLIYVLYNYKNLYLKFIPEKYQIILLNTYNKFIFRMPIISKIYMLIISYKFLFILYICLKQNLNIININNNFITKNIYIKQQIMSFLNKLKSGSSLQESIKYCEFIPNNIKQIIFFEQKIDDIKDSLYGAINIIQYQIEQYITNLQKLLEPLLTVILTLIIVLVIYVLYIPLISINF